MTEKFFVSNLRKIADDVLATTKKEKLYDEIIKQAVVMEILIDEISMLTELNNEYIKKDNMWADYSDLVAKEILSNIPDIVLPKDVDKSLNKIIKQREKIDDMYQNYIDKEKEQKFDDE